MSLYTIAINDVPIVSISADNEEQALDLAESHPRYISATKRLEACGERLDIRVYDAAWKI